MKTILALLLLSTFALAQEPRRFGWLGDSGQKRVMMMAPAAWDTETPAAQSDLSNGLPSVMNQGNLGSCVAQATVCAWSYALRKQGEDHLPISRLLVYYEARKAIGTTSWDSGSQIVDAVNWLQRWGSCKEPMWPYDIRRFTQKAPNAAYTEAKKHKLVQARKVDNADGRSIRLALTNGYPVVVGSLVYSGINRITRQDYVLAMPRKGERPIGGHAYVLVGHDDRKGLYRARNSWGTGWGNRGDFFVPYSYIHSARITEDCWVLLSVSSTQD